VAVRRPAYIALGLSLAYDDVAPGDSDIRFLAHGGPEKLRLHPHRGISPGVCIQYEATIGLRVVTAHGRHMTVIDGDLMHGTPVIID